MAGDIATDAVDMITLKKRAARTTPRPRDSLLEEEESHCQEKK